MIIRGSLAKCACQSWLNASTRGAARLLWQTMSALLALVAVLAASPANATDGDAIVLRIEGAIGPASASYISNGLSEARERNAERVVLVIDTPGGLDSSMREIIREILAMPVPVAAYVDPSGARAASAGTYILYASHLPTPPGSNELNIVHHSTPLHR